MTRSARIIRRDEVDALRSVDAVRAAAERQHQDLMRDAAQEREAMMQAAKHKALQDSMQSAMKIIVDTETVAQQRMTDLEPQVAALISAAVADIIGELDQDEAVERATKQALAKLKDHRRARILTAPDAAAAVRAAVAKMGGIGADVIDVQVDERLNPGRPILSSDQGHVEIGLPDQIRAVTATWVAEEGAP